VTTRRETGKEGKVGKVSSLIFTEQSNFRGRFFPDFTSRRPAGAKTFPSFPSFPCLPGAVPVPNLKYGNTAIIINRPKKAETPRLAGCRATEG
jgi:hypothetical protein